MRSLSHRLGVLSMLALSLAAADARADIFAAVNVAAPPPRTDLDVAIVNASTGSRVSLPSAVNTTAFEIHPSISSDGRRLLFQRFGGSDGIRLLLVDTSTGDRADLFTTNEIAASPIFNSTIEGDGTTVATGRRFRQLQFSSGIRFAPEVTFTDVRAFPTGPYPRVPLLLPTYNAPGSVLDVAFGGNDRFVFHLLPATGLGQLMLFQAGRSPALLSSAAADLGRPAMRADDSPLLVPAFYEHRTYSASTHSFGNSNLGQRTADSNVFGGTNPSVFSPGPINTPADESQPALTRNGRYLAFVRHGSDGRDRLFVRDLSTQTFLNPNGVDLGQVATRGIGSVSLYERAVITSSRITLTGGVNATLTSASSIGILVQRIVGESRVRGQVEYELEAVGRVPLGFFGAGKARTQWDLEVDGEPLPPGRYLVTLRAVEGDVVRELGEPQVLKIHKRGNAHTPAKEER
ncbi:MAG: hypothetical protein DCC71_01690 [Proteobacteria bacterium]|nr:MAG: hypothetical protein DCC71_01690 [Pseudomonadota bacterium]